MIFSTSALANAARLMALIDQHVIQIERLISGREPFGTSRRAAPAPLIDRQPESVRETHYFLTGQRASGVSVNASDERPGLIESG
jgi:hypothetical protein